MELAASDVQSLQEQARKLADCLTSVDEEQAREERGGLDTELAQLETETESSWLRLERSLLKERLREAAGEWSKSALADLLLTVTRRKFEEDRQPTVIRHAEQCFHEITDNRYDHLYAPIGEQTVEVREAASGDTKGPEQLSRGTREQLYLALRFGLIREFSEHGERLPVIVDEALINFDPERAADRRGVHHPRPDQSGDRLHLPHHHAGSLRKRRRDDAEHRRNFCIGIVEPGSVAR